MSYQNEAIYDKAVQKEAAPDPHVETLRDESIEEGGGGGKDDNNAGDLETALFVLPAVSVVGETVVEVVPPPQQHSLWMEIVKDFASSYLDEIARLDLEWATDRAALLGDWPWSGRWSAS